MKKPKRTTPQEITTLTLRQHLGEILDQVTHKRERFLIKRSGVPAAILLSLADYEDLEDRIDTWYEQQDERFSKASEKRVKKSLPPGSRRWTNSIATCTPKKPRSSGRRSNPLICLNTSLLPPFPSRPAKTRCPDASAVCLRALARLQEDPLQGTRLTMSVSFRTNRVNRDFQ